MPKYGQTGNKKEHERGSGDRRSAYARNRRTTSASDNQVYIGRNMENQQYRLESRTHQYSRGNQDQSASHRSVRYDSRDNHSTTYAFSSAESLFPKIHEENLTESENILYGRNPIREALKADRPIEKLLVQKGELSGSAQEIVMTARNQKIHVLEVEKARLDEIAPHHQGLIAIVSAYQYAEVEDMLKLAETRGEAPFLILLDGITDPHNLGAIIRTAECSGAHGVILPQHRSVGLTPSAVKASAGAVEHIPVARVTNLNRTIDDLKKKGIWFYAVTMEGIDYTKVNFHGGTALVIGGEGEGIRRLTEEKCDMAVSLPLKGHLDSLNASVAAGIMMYRVLQCRQE